MLKGMPEAFSKYFSTNAKCVNFVHDDFVYSQEKKENFDSVINSQVYTSCFAILKNKTKNLMDNDYAEGEEEQEEESVYEDEDGESVSTTKKILKKIQAAIKAFKKNS